MVDKQEWEECEKQLEALDYVTRAHVTASQRSGSAFRKGDARTVSVIVTVKGPASSGWLPGRS